MMIARPRLARLVPCLVLGTLALGVACGVEPPADDGTEAPQGEGLTVSGNTLFVVGSATLVPGDAALRQRLVALGQTVTVKTAAAVTAADAAGKLVVISESVTSGDVNTKLRNVTSPVMSLEPLLFDDLGLTAATSNDNGTVTGQTSLLLLAAPGTLAGNVTVPVTGSAQTFAWGRPAATATVLATVASDATRAAIFSYERGAAMVGLTAPARRVGWFATAGAPTAFNSNAWNLFDAAVAWAAAGLRPWTCMTNADCPGTVCANNICSTTCAPGKISSGGACVDKPCTSNADCPGTVCANNVCSTTCVPGKISSGGVCVDKPCTSNADCPGTVCSAGLCTTNCVPGKISSGGACVDKPCTSSADCPGGACIMGLCSAPCAAGQTSCAGTCVDLTTNSANCGTCGVSCAAGQMCQMAACH